MIANPAVACGTKTCSRPSPRPLTNRSASPVRSRTTGRSPVRTVITVVSMTGKSAIRAGALGVEVEYEEHDTHEQEPATAPDEPAHHRHGPSPAPARPGPQAFGAASPGDPPAGTRGHRWRANVPTECPTALTRGGGGGQGR